MISGLLAVTMFDRCGHVQRSVDLIIPPQATLGRVSLRDDEAAQPRGQVEDTLSAEHIRATLSFAGLYQITHELLKTIVLDRVREFYGVDQPARANPYGRPRYQAEVLVLDPSSHFRASLMWLVHATAISQEQADRLDEIYSARQRVTHDLLVNVADPDYLPDIDLFKDALRILTDVHGFWAQMAVDTGRFEHFADVADDDVNPPWAWLLWQCIDAVSDPVDGSLQAGAAEAG
jgi:hypothetical protein